MEVKIKVRFNASKERVESYGGNRYLIYFPFDEDKDSESLITRHLSRIIGTPEKRIFFKTKDVMGNFVFEVN